MSVQMMQYFLVTDDTSERWVVEELLKGLCFSYVCTGKVDRCYPGNTNWNEELKPVLAPTSLSGLIDTENSRLRT